MTSQQILFALNDIDPELLLEATPQGRRFLSRRSLTLILAAALVLSLAACGVAISYAGSNKILEYFRQGPQDLSREQVDFLQDSTQTIAQSQQAGGYTITIDSALTDGKAVYIPLTVTAPEGKILNADNYSCLDGITFSAGERTARSIGLALIPDNDVTDNQIRMLVHAQDIFPEDAGGSFTDGAGWTLTIPSLSAYYADGGQGYYVWEYLVEEPFAFTLDLQSMGDEIQCITQPVTTQVDNSIGLPADAMTNPADLPPNYVPARITSLLLRPMSAELTYEYDTMDIPCTISHLTVILEDGREILLCSPGCFSPGTLSFEATEPVLMDRARFIRFPDGTQIPIPNQ